MIEHEIKYRVTDFANIADAVTKLGFRKANEITQKDIYYSRADVDYTKTLECLRIRHENNHVELTYKPASNSAMKNSNFIWKKEINIKIDTKDSEELQQLLKSLGCRQLCVVSKKRAEYKKGNRTVALDDVKSLGQFIELEILSGLQNKKLIRELESLAKEIGLKKAELVNLPYRDLVIALG